MKLVSWNVNGLRSLVRRDFEAWLAATNYDVVCLQEVKVKEDLLTTHWFENYKAFWNASRRPGISGVATLVRENLAVASIRQGIGDPALDAEGRVLTIDVAGVRVVNLYAPHSHRKLIRLDAKVSFLATLKRFIEQARIDGLPLVLVGDFNIAHQEIDLANPRANQRNAGFLPVEREWITGLLASGFVDAFRHFEQGSGHYTWWSMREGVRARNVGWRLDYAFVEDRLIPSLVACRHLPDRTGSDHCPVVLELREVAPEI
ncbi:exodeoxyribonuclease III [Methylocaldum sp. 14B]|uniref:exodeoxyribonuclease III n=1 Tax=Methylocaldum sp. 14B TaxID=1912213 RepID=UPI000989B202|nr:exodeoxyribonuclease III [Methylocaldum sp. 14B]